jgi:Na+/H+ antiporter NhaD/arsenite permease-like protein
LPAIPVEFPLFALTLVGIAVWHRQALRIAAGGLGVITLHKVAFGTFAEGSGLAGLAAHVAGKWVIFCNLACLLVGFALLSRHVEESRIPQVLPRLLPDGWPGAFALLVLVFVLSSFLDNIAAALIGGVMARSLFPSVHIGFLAAIVAASNAGGSGSVVGDTTTTMMWLAGVPALRVVHAYVAAVVALVVFGLPAARQQTRHARMVREVSDPTTVDWTRVRIVAAILSAAIAVNVAVNTHAPEAAGVFPVLGTTVWLALLATSGLRRPDWRVVPQAARGAVLLLCLVLAASMMPVERLPNASWRTTLGLGFISAVFDNIPLTALAIEQGGYDWGMLAYAVGFGGSMLWFGSSAGVGMTTLFPEARSAARWLHAGWHVAVAYVAGFLVLLAVLGWQPYARSVGP